MYMTIAVLSAVIYYFKGRDWAENKHLAEMPSEKAAVKKRKPL
jgi:hypothetical protein